MIDVRFTKQRLFNHLYYSKWHYVIALVGVVLAFSLFYDMTTPQIPGDQKINILVLDYYMTGDTQSWSDEILAQLPEGQREVRFITLAGGTTSTVDNLELIQARMVTRQDDIILMGSETYQLLAATGAFLPLDEPSQEGSVPLLDRITLPEGVDPAALMITYETTDASGALVKKDGICGVSMIGVRGLLELGSIPDDMVAAVTSYSHNRENAIDALTWIILNKQAGPEVDPQAG